jgi:hypothetical protein
MPEYAGSSTNARASAAERDRDDDPNGELCEIGGVYEWEWEQLECVRELEPEVVELRREEYG